MGASKKNTGNKMSAASGQGKEAVGDADKHAEGKKSTIDPTPAPATTISNEATMQIMRGVLCILHFGC